MKVGLKKLEGGIEVTLDRKALKVLSDALASVNETASRRERESTGHEFRFELFFAKDRIDYGTVELLGRESRQTDEAPVKA